MLWKCENLKCNWTGTERQMLRAPNPFEPNDELTCCPSCREINTMRPACDEPGCTDFGPCGTPVHGGYRWTCFRHVPVEVK